MTRPVSLVLDTSAVLSYVREEIHVGAVLADVADEQGVAAIPLPCLVEAAGLAVDSDRLALLVGHAGTLVIAEDVENWQALVSLCAVTGDYGAACAALAAIDCERWVLSSRGDLYAGISDGELVVPIGD